LTSWTTTAKVPRFHSGSSFPGRLIELAANRGSCLGRFEGTLVKLADEALAKKGELEKRPREPNPEKIPLTAVRRKRQAPTTEPTDAGTDSSAKKRFRHENALPQSGNGAFLIKHSHSAPAPERATSDHRKRRAASGNGSSISAKKVCVGVEDFPDAPMSLPPCELDESIAPVEIVADMLTVCITQPDASTTPRHERANLTNRVLQVSYLRIA